MKTYTKSDFSMTESPRAADAALRPVKKNKKGAYILMSILALGMAYIVTKEVVLPPGLIAAGALIGGAILLVQGMKNPQVITYVLVAYLPFSKVLVGSFGGVAQAFNLTNILMFFIIIAWLNGKHAEGEPLWRRAPLNLPNILFAALAFLALCRASYFSTGYFWLGLIEYKRWVTPLFMYFLVLNTVKEKLMIRNVIVTIMIVTTLVGLMAIYDYIEKGDVGDLDKGRIGGICEHSNSLAAFFCYYMFLPFGFFLQNRGKFKYWLLNIPVLIMFRGIMVTFSRGGYVAFAVGLYAITFIRSRVWFLLLLILTAVAFANPVLLPGGVRYRMGQTFKQPNASFVQNMENTENLENNLDTSASKRLKIWRAGLEMVKEHPVFGVGYGLFNDLLKFYMDEGLEMDAHNSYLIIAAEMGIPALLVFVWIILRTAWNTFLLYLETKDPFVKAFALGFLGGIAALMVSNLFGSRLDSQEVSSYFWILSALVMRYRIIEQREKAEKRIEDKKGLEASPPLPWFERYLGAT